MPTTKRTEGCDPRDIAGVGQIYDLVVWVWGILKSVFKKG